MLSFDTLALTVLEADAYCTARGIADWTGDDTVKGRALRRGQDYIAGEYNARWTVEFTDATAPEVVKYAITEAAVREMQVPFSLTPDIVPGREKVLTGVKGITWEPIKAVGGIAGLKPFITAIDGLLAGVARAGAAGGTMTIERA
jgi:hypothetical protein